MNISYRWLTEMIPGLDLSPQQVADRLAMLGAPVDELVDIGGPLSDIVIARVVERAQHPNADRLSLCTVDAGSGEMLQVVCGAPNVKAGSYYPFAPVGASLPGGLTIRKAKIRGSESQGMLCSARELGLGRDHDGILELHGEFEVGSSFIESMGLDDVRLVVDVTPNRPDLLSHIGVAREIAAAAGLPFRVHDVPGSARLDRIETVGADGSASGGGMNVRIKDTDICPHYLGVVIRGVRVGPSPEWLAGRLRTIGLRPISNIVDATNYVLHELGHPMHAFDLDRLGDTVVVRRASERERITTLDGVGRQLDADMLVIADAARPVAIAGVMGGADTEVQEDTRNILLECAVFDARSVRRTRSRLGLSTDASYRFERGVDAAGTVDAATRAVELILAVAGGEVVEPGAFASAGISDPPVLQLRASRVAQVLGVSFNKETIAKYLEPLGFEVDSDSDGSDDDGSDGDGRLNVRVPGHRRFDVTREDDLVEEIARRHGYDEFPAELRPFRPSSVPTHPLFLLEDRLRTLLTARGLLEAQTAAFAPAEDGDVELLLPLAATESRLRRALMPGLLRRVEANFARSSRSVRLFEIGTVFSAAGDGAGDVPTEATRLAIVCTGYRQPPHWSGEEPPLDVWDLKSLATDVANELGLSMLPAEAGTVGTMLDEALSFRLVRRHDGATIGIAGRARDGAVDAPAWADDVWALEVDLSVGQGATQDVRFAALPQHPSIERDLALLVGAALPAATVRDTILSAGGSLLESAEPFDVYSGKGVAESTRSIAYRLRFRAADRTLTDAEVDAVIRRVLERLNEDLGVVQRA